MATSEDIQIEDTTTNVQPSKFNDDENGELMRKVLPENNDIQESTTDNEEVKSKKKFRPFFLSKKKTRSKQRSKTLPLPQPTLESKETTPPDSFEVSNSYEMITEVADLDKVMETGDFKDMVGIKRSTYYALKEYNSKLIKRLDEEIQKVKELEQEVSSKEELIQTLIGDMRQKSQNLQELGELSTHQGIELLKSDTLSKHAVAAENVEETDMKIGKGSYGKAYLIRINGTLCIKKSLHNILLGIGYSDVGEEQQSTLRGKFHHECDLLFRMHHPNVVQFMGVQYDEDSRDSALNLSLIMEYLPATIEDCITECKKEDYKFPLSVNLSILSDVSCGLSHLHFNNIIHRDLSASNVLLTPSLSAKLADFGVSKLLDPLESAKMTQCPGTPYTLPPEALELTPEYTVKYDTYSFGTLSVYFLSGEVPVNQLQLATQINNLKHNHDSSVIAIIEHCTRQKSKDRPSATKITNKISNSIKKSGFDLYADKITFLSGTKLGRKMMIPPEHHIL